MPDSPPSASRGDALLARIANSGSSIDPLLQSVRAELLLPDTNHPIFHGAWDWHSSVHGHWALLVLGALRGRRSDVRWVADRLRSDAWSLEIEGLVAQPEFELPYGRAWLLALVSAYERLTGDRALRASMSPVVEQLHSWCTSTALGPETQEYQNPCWPLLHLWRWYDKEPATRRTLEEHIRERCIGHDLSLETDHDPPGTFFSRWSLVAHLLGETLGDRALSQWLREENVDPTTLEPITELHSAHHLGTNGTRAWGFASAYRATRDPRWRDAYLRHVEASLALHETWADDRHAYRHWVPQFTLYAIHLAAEDSSLMIRGEAS